MASGFKEPKTNAEAKKLQDFLRGGAETQIETVKTFAAAPRQPLSIDRPVRADLDARPADVAALLAKEQDAAAYVEVDFDDVTPQAPTVFVYLSTDDASAHDPAGAPKDPAFVGAVGFFVHAEMPESRHTTVRLKAPAAAAKDNADRRLGVVLVPVAVRRAVKDFRAPTLAAARLQVLRSIVKEH
jgi:hypothetical protein